MLSELVSIPTDTAALDGLYSEPAEREAEHVVQLFHGNGANFYTGPSRFLPEHLVPRGFACLAYNRRGHETLTTRTREPEGNAFQTSAQALADNEYARQWLAASGHAHPVVVGHSNGGLLAAQHVAAHPDTPALVLLSAHCGGREMLERASALGLLAGDQLAELSQRAHTLVDEGRPQQLMLLPGWWYVTSAASFVDMEEGAPRLLDAAPAIECPVLFLRGELEDPDLYPAEQYARAAGGPVEVRIIKGSDHFYTGLQPQVGALVAEWLDATLRDHRAAPPRTTATGGPA